MTVIYCTVPPSYSGCSVNATVLQGEMDRVGFGRTSRFDLEVATGGRWFGLYLSIERMIDLLTRHQLLDHILHSSQSTPNSSMLLQGSESRCRIGDESSEYSSDLNLKTGRVISLSEYHQLSDLLDIAMWLEAISCTNRL
ncbi:hypothetical protein COCNU_01G005340 [Cocos nucifera]|uniref:Uncharacterized protein n=1 Tax=Cocos nucifera TaxID=13894 RepID=A0A8K0HUV8_COCNU|nr:hypothetical protein COCNU_01G005340 [Cocos nucifera]